MQVTVRFFAAAKAAIGEPERRVTVPDSATVGDLLTDVAPGEDIRRVLASCSFLVDGVSTTDPATPLSDGVTVDLLPPFAGG